MLKLATIEVAAVMSKASGEPIREDMIAADVAAGAPTNPDGTINLVVYAAWLAREDLGRGD